MFPPYTFKKLAMLEVKDGHIEISVDVFFGTCFPASHALLQ
jgi:hypothetical protein